MRERRLTIGEIEHDLRSDSQEVRGAAMGNLLRQVRRNPEIHQEAIQTFRSYLQSEHDGWTSSMAVHGIEHILGLAAARECWLRMLNASRTDLVATAALSVIDLSYFDVLVDLLRRRSEPQIRIAVLRTIGRMQHPHALEIILEHLHDPALQQEAIEALRELGDARAIPHLEPLLNDETVLPIPDERGARLRACDVADQAIRSLQKPAAASAQPVTPLLSYSAPADPIENAEYTSPWNFRLVYLLPLAIALLEIPFVAAIIFHPLLTSGAVAQTPAQVRRLDMIAMVLPVTGLCIAVALAPRGERPRLASEIFWLVVGAFACVTLLFCFGWELTH